jgi:hypothetical protein
MKEFIDKLIERLEESKKEYLEGFRTHKENELYGVACGFGDSIKIVNQLAEEYKVSEMSTSWIAERFEKVE